MKLQKSLHCFYIKNKYGNIFYKQGVWLPKSCFGPLQKSPRNWSNISGAMKWIKNYSSYPASDLVIVETDHNGCDSIIHKVA